MNEAIEDFNGAIDGIRNIRNDYKREGMTDDTGAPWAMYRLYEIIERAALKLSDEIKTKNPLIPWTILLKPRHYFISELRRNDDDLLDVDKMWEVSGEIVQTAPLSE